MSEMFERHQIERTEKWAEWVKDIPSIKFPPDWSVQVIPPFGGAMARFVVSTEKARVSVYLDVYDRLGYFGSPYWEIHPYEDDVMRYPMSSVDELLKGIAESIEEQERNSLTRREDWQ